ncbi:uncharacterized protein LOC110836256 isoform X2 [Zootermopsis nevadensis]|uniref:uncharacterized protein LOC110836256 isoform X2 n=1 Tax=Zootermopsis nevadensis TaxID=136037 RepID=UPI000B8E9CC3|nr:uncharacterized protein LOC110836256 isoform X2 [Zootermopsis nevadensis]
MQTDTSNWTGQNFMAAGWSGLLTGAAVCTFGFLGFVGIVSQSCVQSQGRKLRLAAAGVTLLVMFLSYCAVAVVVSMMVQFQALNWSPVPLLRVFEIRDVDWARLVMATLSILGLSLALLEVCTPLYVLVVCLSREEWRILPCALGRENASTGTPVLAILAAGIPASLLACVCPLWLLVQVMCVGPLIDHAFIAATVIHRRYQPHTPVRTKNAADKRVNYHHMDQNSMSLCHPLDDYDEFDDDDTEAEGQKQHKLTVRCLKSGLGFLPAVLRQHVSSGPLQQYYTSLSSPGAVHNGIPRTQTDLSSATFSSESIDVTYMDPDSISLVQRNVMKNEINHSFSNGTIVTSLSYDSMTQGQMDTRYMTNGSVTSLKSIESVIMDQSELELKNVPVPSVKCPNSVIHIQDDAKIIGDHPFVSTESRLSAERRQDSVGSSCSLNGDEEGSKVTCHGSVNSSRKAFNFSNGKLIINGDAIEDLSMVGSDCDTLSANGAKRCNNESGATGYEEQDRTTHSAGDDSDTDNEGATLSSASTCGGEADDSDDSTTDIDAIVAEYKERIKKFTVLTGSHNADRCAASSVRTHSSNRSTCHAVVGRGSGLRVGGGDSYSPSRSRDSVVWEPGCCGNPVSPSCDRTATTKPSGSGNHRASCPLAASRSGSHQHNPVFAAFGDRLASQRPLASYRSRTLLAKTLSVVAT